MIDQGYSYKPIAVEFKPQQWQHLVSIAKERICQNNVLAGTNFCY